MSQYTPSAWHLVSSANHRHSTVDDCTADTAVCQGLIGKFVTTRNISNLLNEISPCSITEFKDTGLEYICLQLESMLENHLLDDLDEELLLELDEVVRDNQLARLPFVRSGRAELLLHDSHPELAADIDEERQARIKEMAYKASQRDDEKKLSSSFKARMGSLDEGSPLQTPDTTRRKSRGGRNEPFSPSLRPKQSQADMIFDMEDEDGSLSAKPRSPMNEAVNIRSPPEIDDMPQLPKAWRESKGKELAGSALSPVPLAFSMSPESQPSELGSLKTPGGAMSKPGAPWSASKLATSKLDLKDIMSEASTSALTAGLQAQRKQDAAANKPQTKISQKERKRQLQALAAAEAAAKDESTNHVPWESVSEGGRPAPWKAASPAPKTSLKEAMSAESNMPRGVSANAKPLVASETRAKTATRRTASPDTRFPGQGRTNSSPAIVAGPSTEQQPKKPLVPHSKSYITPAPKAEPTLGFSMADIIGQQKREQEAVKEAVAKRSLQEIQQEQAFQEWWDQESRRTQEEEARRKQKEGREKDNKGTKRGGRRGRGGKAKGTGEAATNSGQSGANGSRGGGTAGSSNTNTRGSGGGRGGGGVGGGRGRGGKGRGNKP